MIQSRSGRRSGFTAGSLIVNADDWGRSYDTTERTLECVLRGSVSSVSAMVFMEDSERAAALARERGVDAGLHLNLTTAFTAPTCPAALRRHHDALASYLHRPFGGLVFHPGLVNSFNYVVAAQVDEFRRLYGSDPARLDGHHHAHLCANVLYAGLLPPGTIVRRNFFFERGEKSFANRLFRRFSDRILARRHRVVDFFFSIAPLEPAARLQRIFSLGEEFVIEVETHPVNPEEHRFLADGRIFDLLGGVPIAPRFAVPPAAVAG